MRRQPEKAEQAAIVELLELLQAKVYVLGTKRPTGDYQGTRQTPGIPDLLAFLPPADKGLSPYKQLWIEVKAPAGKMRDAQKQFRELCIFSRQGHVVGGIDAVMEYLTEGGWLKSSPREARR